MVGHIVAKFGKKAKECCSVIPYAMLSPQTSQRDGFLGFASLSSVEDTSNWVAPRDGSLESLVINVPANNIDGATVFVVRVSPKCNAPFADTSLKITVPANPFGTGCFEVNKQVKIKKGDRVSLRMTTGGTTGSISATGGLLFG